jgi:hypothetical protein
MGWLFVGEYGEAKEIMTRLDAMNVRNRLALPPGLPPSTVVVEVMKRSLPQARELISRNQ